MAHRHSYRQKLPPCNEEPGELLQPHHLFRKCSAAALLSLLWYGSTLGRRYLQTLCRGICCGYLCCWNCTRLNLSVRRSLSYTRKRLGDNCACSLKTFPICRRWVDRFQLWNIEENDHFIHIFTSTRDFLITNRQYRGGYMSVSGTNCAIQKPEPFCTESDPFKKVLIFH